MDKTRILSGELLVTKGALKLNASLPEVGLKDVLSNGSWLEQKQIQASLEARKQLIEVERIEKSGVLSHAEWHEELMLAEVTQQVGGYWQYLGHSMGKRLFLNPEEALFLMETNCLLLKYNDVKVSLQQAYALMLRSKISLMEYKVYASLSRLGYRVFRHHGQPESRPKIYENKLNKDNSNQNTEKSNPENGNLLGNDPTAILAKVTMNNETNLLDKNDSEHETREENERDDTTPKISKDIPAHDDSINIEKSKVSTEDNPTPEAEQASTSRNAKKIEMKINKLKDAKYIEYKINRLKSRKHKTKDCNTVNKDYFENIPEFTKNPVVSIKAPDDRYLPCNVLLRNNSYYLNVEKIRTKSTTPEEIPTTTPSSNNVMNTIYPNNVNHLRHPPPPTHSYRGNNWTEYFNLRFSSQPNPFRHFNFWRPQSNLNYFQLNMSFQRPFIQSQFNPRLLNPLLHRFEAQNLSANEPLNSNNNARRKKRTRDILKQEHYASIQKLATLVKSSILELRLSNYKVSELNYLIQTYNVRYKSRLRLSSDFTVIVNENIIDTIEVDDDEEPIAKVTKKNENPDVFNDNLQRLKQLASQLKSLDNKSEATSMHRRMFSNVIKRFNNSYNAHYYVNDNFDVVNKNDLTVLSSSDIEGVSDTTARLAPGKKLKNPFSILKRLSEKNINDDCASTSSVLQCPFTYNNITLKTFNNNWLPDIFDFGRPEIVSEEFVNEVIDTRREEFLFDFMKTHPDKFKCWLDIKISFIQCLQETLELFHYDENKEHMRLESLVKPEEFNDASMVLKKLSIFENHKTFNKETNLAVDFDVYNRDVQNFKKTNRPLPHFRVICMKESSTLPSGADVMALHSKYKDNVTIVFAVAGISSVSYLQVNPVDLSVHKSVTSNTNTV